MLTQSAQEKLVTDVLRASCEAVTLGDFRVRILPLLERTFDTSASLLYQCNERGEALPVAGTLVEAAHEYYTRYSFQDPIQDSLRRLNPLILVPSHLPEWKAYLKSPIYMEFQRPRQVHYFVHLRLLKDRHEEPGMVGMLLTHSPRQSDFGARNGAILVRLLPFLGAAARRNERWEKQLRMQSCVEAMLQRSLRPLIAFDPHGRLLWASERTENLLNLTRGGKDLPEALIGAVRRLGRLVNKRPDLDFPPQSVLIPRKDGLPLSADLRLACGRDGGYFVLVEMEDPDVSPRVAETAARFDLTEAETGVLALLSLGFSDHEIGRRLFISRPTVRTHVGRILDKMGIHSRVKATLLAHGIKLPVDPLDE